MADAFERSEHKMREHGMSDTAIAQFEHLYEVWSNEESTSWIREEEVEPITDIPSFHDVYETINHEKAVDAFAKTAFLKLNGGLGTSMGLDYAKSLLPVRRHKAKPMRFLDIILGQVVTARKRLGVALPLTLMDSFRTSRDTMAAVAKDRHFEQKDVPVEIIQHMLRCRRAGPPGDIGTGRRHRNACAPDQLPRADLLGADLDAGESGVHHRMNHFRHRTPAGVLRSDHKILGNIKGFSRIHLTPPPG